MSELSDRDVEDRQYLLVRLIRLEGATRHHFTGCGCDLCNARRTVKEKLDGLDRMKQKLERILSGSNPMLG